MCVSAIPRLALVFLLFGGVACSRATAMSSVAGGSAPAVASPSPALPSTPDAIAEPSSTALAPANASPEPAPLTEFTLPRFHVSGRITPKGVDPATNTMESPDSKDEVAYYVFTPLPGSGCQASGRCANTVLAGHVDWYPAQVGVFWHLKDLKDGDEVRLKSADGAVYRYRVVANTTYPATAMPMDQILAETPEESITLVTCDGSFDKRSGEYDARRVVRAVRET